jgi:hypothetical protein
MEFPRVVTFEAKPPPSMVIDCVMEPSRRRRDRAHSPDPRRESRSLVREGFEKQRAGADPLLAATQGWP